MLRAISILVAGAALSLSGAHAQDRNVRDAITAKQLEDVLSNAGLNPTMLRDKTTGAPVATGKFYDNANRSILDQPKETVFAVRGMDCSGIPVSCGQLVLYATFNLDREVTEQDFRVVNEWNDTSMFGRAFVLEEKQKIGVDFRLDMIGGVTGDHVNGRIGRWPEVLKEFREKLEAAQDGS
ncbi:YbjN domain-containing protein [Parvularcula marina]|jgi:hypothetical protein|nr:YbjN domain-containing protein [Parvularcula marina]